MNLIEYNRGEKTHNTPLLLFGQRGKERGRKRKERPVNEMNMARQGKGNRGEMQQGSREAGGGSRIKERSANC